MRPESGTGPDDRQPSGLTRTEVGALGAAAAVIVVAALAMLTGEGALAAALGGALFGGVVGAWAGVVLERRARPAEPPVAYTVVTHERPGWRTVDLRDGRHAQR
jgi:membrane associated rhomboid family serine protease